MLRKFRRRQRRSPIRRKPDGLQLIRLDDRIAPGSVFATAAAQAVVLAGPLAWLGLSGAESIAAAPASEALASPPWTEADLGDSGLADFAPGFFALSSPDATAGSSASQSLLVGLGEPSPGVVLTDLGEPGASATGGTATPTNAASTGVGSPSAVGAPDTAAIRSAGFAVTGGLPAKPAADTGSPNSPSPVRGGAKSSGTAAGSPVANAPGLPKPISTPPGHFGARLQTLLHSGATSGSFSLTDTANQQAQIGALVGSQLTGAAGLGAASTTAHRPASLLGQTLADGSNKNLGLRTSTSSSGMFGLVGSQSIGDLLSGPTPGGSGGLASAAGAVAAAVPAAGALPSLHGPANAAGPDPAAGLPGATLTRHLLRPGTYAQDAAGQTSPDPYSADFALTIEYSNPDYQQWGVGDPPFNVVEQGTITFVGLGDPSNGYGPDYIQAELNADVTINYDGPTGGSDFGLSWTGYATPAGLLLGFDIDQFNQQAFGVNGAEATSYVLDAIGNVPFTAADTSTPTDQNGTVTTTNQNNYTTSGTDNFKVHIEGSGANHQVTWDDTVNSTVSGYDQGSDTTALSSGYSTDTFLDASTDTHTETDHTEGTIGPDGTFQLTSFSIDSTDDSSFNDSYTGADGSPEPGGSESDTTSGGDNGTDHEHLVVSGTPDAWTASLDDNAQANYNDGETGSESSSQTTSGTTDTNGDTFGAADGGTHTDVLHFAGSGDATTFTATSVSDRIEDVSTFNDSDGGTAGETKTGEADTDAYTATDNGTADEVLTIGGDANSLTAGYTDQVHDGFTDSDNIHDNWNGPDGVGTGEGSTQSLGDGGGSQGTDSGTDHSTDGDNGSEDATLSAGATLANWQSDSTTDPAPAWQVTSVGGDITGTAAVNAGDNGTDTDAQASNSQDSDTDHFVDSSTGADTFQFHLAGDGTTATLQPTVTYGLTTHSQDDNTSRWNDPEVLDGEAGTDSGSETVGTTSDDTGTVTVGETESLAADGTTTVTASTADLTDTGTVHQTDSGTDAPAAADVNDLETVNDSATVGETIHLHTDTPTAGAVANVSLDQQLNGSISLGGTEDDSNSENPNDTDTDVANGTFTGPINGHIEATGTADGDQMYMAHEDGAMGLHLAGADTETNTETIVSTPDAPRAVPLPENYFHVDGLGTVAWALPMAVPDPAATIGATLSADLPISATVTIAHTVSVPSAVVDLNADDNAGNWSPDDFATASDVIDSTTTTGTYQNCMFGLGFSGSGAMLDSTETVTGEDGNAAGLEGSETVTHTLTMHADGTLTSGDVTGATAHADANLKEIQTVTGGEGPGGGANIDVMPGGGGAATIHTTQTDDADGIGHWSYVIPWSHTGPQGSGSGVQGLAWTSVRNYHVAGTDDNGTIAVTAASGTDSVVLAYNYLSATPTISVSYGFDGRLDQGQSRDQENGEIVETSTDSSYWHQSVKDLSSGQISFFNSDGTPVNAVEENIWSRLFNPLTSAPDMNPDSIGAPGFWTSLIPIYGPFRSMINDLQNGRIGSAGLNAVFVGLDIYGVGEAYRFGKGAARWAGVKVFGEAVAEKTGQKVAANAGARAAQARKAMPKFIGCFPADSPVATEHGPMPIQDVAAKDKVWAFDHVAGVWKLCCVTETYRHEYDGDMVAVTVADEVIEATRHHPFWVVRGEALAGRPQPEHVPDAPAGSRLSGRWVDAGDLRVGDTLLLRSGEQAPVTRLVVRQTQQPVYNFQVEGLHCYTVGGCEVLVHNNSAANLNKTHHIFDKAGHNLGPLLSKYGGSQQAAYQAVHNALTAAVQKQGITGLIRDLVVEVDGLKVTVRGNVVNGVPRIGTFFIP